jgi:hypothetical protein
MLLIGILSIGCKGDHKKDNVEVQIEASDSNLSEAQKLVNKTITHYGGMKNWESKKSLSYVKTIQSYDSMGGLIRTVAQSHKYQLKPSFKANMSWEQDGNKHEIVNNGNQSWKLVNGKIQEDKASVDNAWNSSFGSHYMVSMPFKLKDPGTILNYEGVDTLSNNRIVHKLKVDYEKGAGSCGGMHTWNYFLNTDTYQFEANFLDHGEGYSYTDYETFIQIDSILVTKERKLYASNKNMELTYLKTQFSNSDIQFDVELPEELFKVNN